MVRLTQGDFNACTIYSNDPSQVAREWESAGAQWIHVVDLEGAKTGVLSNDRWVAMICKSVKAHVQCGGGLRNMDSIRRVLDLGVARVVLGTRALEPVFLEQCVRQFADRLAVGLDVRGGFVKTSGWTRDGNMKLADALAQCNQLGVQTVICTDIDKDGVLEGPNFKNWKKSFLKQKPGDSSEESQRFRIWKNVERSAHRILMGPSSEKALRKIHFDTSVSIYR